MSGGQRQAVAVTRAAAVASRVVILDEPTGALGVREARRVLDLIYRLRDGGRAVIVVSHALDHVIDVADRAVVLRRGRKVGEVAPSAETHERIVSLIVEVVSERSVVLRLPPGLEGHGGQALRCYCRAAERTRKRCFGVNPPCLKGRRCLGNGMQEDVLLCTS